MQRRRRAGVTDCSTRLVVGGGEPAEPVRAGRGRGGAEDPDDERRRAARTATGRVIPSPTGAPRRPGARGRGPPATGWCRSGTPHASAASSYEHPITWVSTKAARWSSGSSSTSADTAWASLGSTVLGRPGQRRPGARAAPASRRRRTVRRTWSAHARRAIESSQVRALESPRKAGSAFHARTNVSWVTSSASSGPTRW